MIRYRIIGSILSNPQSTIRNPQSRGIAEYWVIGAMESGGDVGYWKFGGDVVGYGM